MQNTNTNENEVTTEISVGIPTCDCGECINELFGDNDEISVSMEAPKNWMLKVCPGKKAA